MMAGLHMDGHVLARPECRDIHEPLLALMDHLYLRVAVDDESLVLPNGTLLPVHVNHDGADIAAIGVGLHADNHAVNDMMAGFLGSSVAVNGCQTQNETRHGAQLD